MRDKIRVLKQGLWHSCLPINFLIERDAAADLEGKMSRCGYILNHPFAFPEFGYTKSLEEAAYPMLALTGGEER